MRSSCERNKIKILLRWESVEFNAQPLVWVASWYHEKRVAVKGCLSFCCVESVLAPIQSGSAENQQTRLRYHILHFPTNQTQGQLLHEALVLEGFQCADGGIGMLFHQLLTLLQSVESNEGVLLAVHAGGLA